MTAPTEPVRAGANEEEQRVFRAMATDVTLRVVHPTVRAPSALDRARRVFADVESACTRFDPTSPLMVANADPGTWHEVPRCCARACREAGRAHRATDGLFDPRVLDVLNELGYSRTLPFHDGQPLSVTAPLTPSRRRPRRGQSRWRPRTEHRPGHHRIHLDGSAIDLGGIGKGLAVRWAWQELRTSGESVMVDAGGDCRFSGPGPERAGWLVGVEDPRGGDGPVAVLSLLDVGCATSSVRVRRWQVDGRTVHHLIDPRTGTSGGDGLLAVTVVHPDPAWAEVWSKSLFLCGAAAIEQTAVAHGLPALWVTSSGTLHHTDLARPLITWTTQHGYL
jgi:thiamine biosynthesis lipoprotein